jgi:hypothetical protein
MVKAIYHHIDENRKPERAHVNIRVQSETLGILASDCYGGKATWASLEATRKGDEQEGNGLRVVHR